MRNRRNGIIVDLVVSPTGNSKHRQDGEEMGHAAAELAQTLKEPSYNNIVVPMQSLLHPRLRNPRAPGTPLCRPSILLLPKTALQKDPADDPRELAPTHTPKEWMSFHLEYSLSVGGIISVARNTNYCSSAKETFGAPNQPTPFKTD